MVIPSIMMCFPWQYIYLRRTLLVVAHEQLFLVPATTLLGLSTAFESWSVILHAQLVQLLKQESRPLSLANAVNLALRDSRSGGLFEAAVGLHTY